MAGRGESRGQIWLGGPTRVALAISDDAHPTRVSNSNIACISSHHFFLSISCCTYLVPMTSSQTSPCASETATSAFTATRLFAYGKDVSTGALRISHTLGLHILAFRLCRMARTLLTPLRASTISSGYVPPSSKQSTPNHPNMQTVNSRLRARTLL